MATTVATLIAKLEAQTRDFDRNISTSERRLKDLERSASGAGQGIQRMGTLMRAAAASGALAFAADLFRVGVQVEAWGRRFDTVFGEAAESVRIWADEVNERLGVSEERLQGTAAAVGDLFVPMGFARQAAADMTMEVLTLSAALSEWTGGQYSAADASNIITRAILGEREALIGLGVKISEAQVDAAMLEAGFADLTGQAFEQARAMVTLELITAKSADAMTAFADGGSEAMIAQNNLKASLDDLKVSMSQLIVEAAPLVKALASVVGILATPFQAHTVDTLNAYRDAMLGVSDAQLEALRSNEMLYASVMRTLLLLSGGREFGPKGRKAGAAVGASPGGQGRHSGGMVPGPSGMSVPIMAMAGERVVPAGMSSGGGGGGVVINVAGSVVSERELLDLVRAGLRGDRIRGGSLEL